MPLSKLPIPNPNNFKFEVKQSPIEGQGLFAASIIPARRKLGELTGELITLREARKRTRGAADHIFIVEFGDNWALDSTRSDNYFKFMNHSCTPNAFMRLSRGRVEFYALRRILPGEELTCDYGETHHDGKLECRCRSAGCRKYL
jgi:uncharacterized protein